MGNFSKPPTATRVIRGKVDHHKSVFENAVAASRYLQIRYIVERGIAVALLVLSLPLLFVLGCLVRLNSKGKVIYKQTRVGLNGKRFSMFKLRTMVADAEHKSGPAWCTESDPRITLVGKALRFLHLDELPQLLNVAKGEMSFIGPRPERPAFVEILNDKVQDYSQRLNVKPGITGLAQIYFPADQTLNCVVKKVKMDKAYIESVAIGIDLKIAICTALRMLGVRGGKGPRMTGLNRRYEPILKECAAVDRSTVEPPTIADFMLSPPDNIELGVPVLVGGSEFEKPSTDLPNKPR